MKGIQAFIYSYYKNNTVFYLLLLVYSIVSLVTLTEFPLVHSDEAWLALMSKEMVEKKSIFLTESFFDLMPRTVHTMKSLYHIIQGLMISFFGFSLFNVRSISLIASLLTVIQLYHILILHFKRKVFSSLMALASASSVYFVYIGHFARQEMLLLLVLTTCYHLYITQHRTSKILIPVLIGISISLHPNAFILSLMLGFLYIKDFFLALLNLWHLPANLLEQDAKNEELSYTTRKHLKNHCVNLLLFLIILSCFALSHLVLSFFHNPAFFSQYIAYGSTLSVDAPLHMRFDNFVSFYIKILMQISGTYYLPPLYLEGIYLLVQLGMIGGITLHYRLHYKLQPKTQTQSTFIITNSNTGLVYNFIALFLGFNLAIFIIGRFNPTSIIFLWLPVTLLSALTMNLLLSMPQIAIKKGLGTLFLALLICINLLTTYKEYKKIVLTPHAYDNYISHITPYLNESSIVLGNLSAGFAFEHTTFYDIRNLAFLGNMSIDDYIKKNKINLIIYYEEYDYIHRNDQWQILYGKDSYYDELKHFLRSRTQLVHEFESTDYGTRIVDYIHDYPFKIQFYVVDAPIP